MEATAAIVDDFDFEAEDECECIASLATEGEGRIAVVVPVEDDRVAAAADVPGLTTRSRSKSLIMRCSVPPVMC